MIKEEIKKGITHGIVFFTTVGFLSFTYATITNIWTNTLELEVTTESTLSATSWNKLLGNFEFLKNKTENISNNLLSEVDTVAAQYFLGTAQALPNGTSTIINFNTKVYDSHNAVTTGSNWNFIAPKDGLYRVNASMGTSSYSWTDPNSSLWLMLYKNGSHVKTFASSYVYTTISTGGQINGTAIVELNSGDSINIQGVIWRSSSSTTLPISSHNNRISIERIGNKVN